MMVLSPAAITVVENGKLDRSTGSLLLVQDSDVETAQGCASGY